MVTPHTARNDSELTVHVGDTVLLLSVESDLLHALCDKNGVKGRIPLECLDTDAP